MPEIFFSTMDEVPEGLKEIAKTVDGKVSVNVVPKIKLDEFREKNIELSKEKETLEATNKSLLTVVGEDADLEAFATELTELREIKQKVDDGKLKGDDTIAKEVENRIKAVKNDYENQLKEVATKAKNFETEAKEYASKFKRSIVDREVTNAVLAEESGANPQALSDILTRAYSTFQVGEDGKLVAKDGEATIYGSDGATPQTPSEWLQGLKEKAPYFFKSSTGGGGGGSTDTKLPGGMKQADFDKLPASERLRLAREQNK